MALVDDGTLFRSDRNKFPLDRSDDASPSLDQGAGAEIRAQRAPKDGSKVKSTMLRSRPEVPRHSAPNPVEPGTRPTVASFPYSASPLADWVGSNGLPLMFSRTGYTGDLGYEVFCHPGDASAVWTSIMEAGEPHGISPFGLEALDLVRIEAGLVFGGYEFCSQTDPFEAGIGFAVPSKKQDDYVGKVALERPSRKSSAQVLVGLGSRQRTCGGMATKSMPDVRGRHR